jgi:hypothetical protein
MITTIATLHHRTTITTTLPPLPLSTAATKPSPLLSSLPTNTATATSTKLHPIIIGYHQYRCHHRHHHHCLPLPPPPTIATTTTTTST